MKISKELRERIQRLETEQKKQAAELTDLNELRDLVAIAELEQELTEVSKTVTGKPAPTKIKDIDAAKEAAKLGGNVKDVKVQTAEKVSDIDLAKEQAFSGKKGQQVAGGLAVCLLFNKNSPSEWSDEAGGGWRGRGMGTHYPTQDEAKAKLQELKTKWPDYPIEIRKAK